MTAARPASVIRAAATVGGFTLISRVLGFVRDQIFANVLGAGMVADAFLLAQRFPNLFRSLFAEGAFSSAFVPMVSKRLAAEGPGAARAFAEEALNVLVPLLLALTVIAQIAMPWIMIVYAPGFSAEPAKFDLAVLFSRITFPYLMLMALCALYAGILNALSLFWVAAAAPILLNLVLILGLVVVAPITGLPGHGQAFGVTLSGILQVAWMARAARRAGMDLRLGAPRLTPAVVQLLKVALPGTFAAGVTQINAWIGGIIASWTAGAVSWLYFADRLYQLPLGAIGIAVGAVLLPDLSRRLALGDDAGAMAAQNRAAEACMLLTMPAAAALMAIPLDILIALFRHGAFGLADAQATAPALAAFAAGLPAYVLIKVFTPAFFAREDTGTPVVFAAASVGVNIAGSILLYPWLDYVGIAVATAAAAWLNVGLLVHRLARRGHFHADARLLSRLARIALASAALALALRGAAPLLAPWLRAGVLVAMPTLGGLVLAGAALYGALALALGAADRADLRRVLGRGRP